MSQGGWTQVTQLADRGSAMTLERATEVVRLLESPHALRLRHFLRQRCRPVAAPEALRHRILASLPHRRSGH